MSFLKAVGLYGKILRPNKHKLNNTRFIKKKNQYLKITVHQSNDLKIRSAWKKQTFIKLIWFGVKWLEKGWYAVKQNNQPKIEDC